MIPMGNPATEHGTPWRQQVLRRVDILKTEVARIPRPASTPQQQATLSRLDLCLQAAQEAAVGDVGVIQWWWGTKVELAWRNLRQVEEGLIDFAVGSELDALAADALGRAKRSDVSDSDPRVLHLQALLLEAVKRNARLAVVGVSAARRAILDVFRVSHYNSDQKNQQARAFRNRVFVAILFTVIAGAALVIVQWRIKNQAIIAAPDPAWPPGSNWWLLLQVMAFGSIGALLTAIPALAAIPLDFSPFNLPFPQAVLKIALGSLTAVVGLTIVFATRTAGVNGRPTDWTSLFFLAVVLGAGQQAVTQFVDRRAGQILSGAGAGR